MFNQTDAQVISSFCCFVLRPKGLKSSMGVFISLKKYDGHDFGLLFFRYQCKQCVNKAFLKGNIHLSVIRWLISELQNLHVFAM